MMKLSYESRALSEDLIYVELKGEFGYPDVLHTKDELYRLLGKAKKNLLIDLNSLEYIDSVGIGVIIGLQKRASELEGTLSLICRKGKIFKIIELVGLDKAFNLFSSFAAARQSLLGVS
ncbi:MAG: STAS domain-containing protein [Candidatus Eremiobacteraeota bacterium]|nr:STAS domain-containing protein [Candidatus Eremiobacteraeota bacterium]